MTPSDELISIRSELVKAIARVRSAQGELTRMRDHLYLLEGQGAKADDTVSEIMDRIEQMSLMAEEYQFVLARHRDEVRRSMVRRISRGVGNERRETGQASHRHPQGLEDAPG